MPRWVALLRAVNLGSRNRVPMAELRAALEELGCSEVRTHLQSGNAVFRRRSTKRERLAAELEALLVERFGVEQPVILRTAEELVALRDGHPFGDDVSGTYVAFLRAEPAPARVAALAELAPAAERVLVVGSDAYLRYPAGVARATLTPALLEKRLGVAATARNWRTVSALAALAEA